MTGVSEVRHYFRGTWKVNGVYPAIPPVTRQLVHGSSPLGEAALSWSTSKPSRDLLYACAHNAVRLYADYQAIVTKVPIIG
jgi:hypothetical protein